ncbi:5'-nucleotidase, lipoprotein e(P4) family [Marilutibacter maris]|uniref:Acid phosphatase n=1 Tax=Marilutibacter maris TaxID=1605891 RepID=A0A2U9T0T4_9GAMM|nr:5'-nucleotidase, lipoprotein e(P4) family [Lysobacter maris]AWV05951.1 acid phosphatase [Lysobacter maris]
MRRIPVLSLLAVSVLALGACKPVSFTAPEHEAEPQRSAATPTAEVPADDNLNAVLWVQTSSEYQALTEQTYKAAADHLDKALSEAHWDALVPSERAGTAGLDGSLKPAVIMDVDETVLDNSPYQARLIRDGQAYDEVSWAAWVAEKKAKPVPGVLDFATAAAAKGVTILYLSNRAEHLQEATLANLREVGMPVASEDVFLGLGTFVEGCEQNGSEKVCRRQLAGRQYRVLMQFGDQLGDFVEVLDNTAAGREPLMEEYGDWFGERWWMLPNPTYGSWEPAAFNNDWSQPIEVRRAGKRAALDMAP